MSKTIMLLSASLFIFACNACSSDPKIHELPVTSDPSAELSKTDSDLAQAEALQVNVLSPENFYKAKEAAKNAHKSLSSEKDQKSILREIAKANAYLEKANEISGISNEILANVMRERKDAIEAGAPKYFAKEFKAADIDLRSATVEIESHNTKAAEKKRDQLEKRYNKLELDSIRLAKLGPARQDLKEAAKEGAKTLTPETYAWALKQVDSDDEAIMADRHNDVEVEKRSADATAASRRVLLMVRQAKKAKQETPEQIAAQVLKDKAEAAQAAKEAANEKKNVSELSKENQDLETATRVEKKYEMAKNLFSENEAEVYKQGNNIVLRLKGLTFPKNEAVIPTSNFPLLAKVQDVIRESGDAQVTVEGHTDSTGPRAINKKLSEERATAVETYLEANKIIDKDKISATGFADSKPIATNKTAEGRAQNRRVDVIIMTK